MAIVFGYRIEVGQRPLVGIEGDSVDDRRPRAAFVSRRQRVGDPAACAAESTDDELNSDSSERYAKKNVLGDP